MASKPAKIFRDPLYNYISIDRKHDGWLLELLDSPEVQRLRRIHQLGVSYLTYPGADHNRLAHSLGVLHLMQQAIQHLTTIHDKEEISQARAALLATALLHDVGHGPFSHLFEPCLGIDHEVWSQRIILDEGTTVHKVLHGIDKYLPNKVAELIKKDNYDHPAWQKALLSSQLDMDRLDYLRRDSLFTGAGYGHFDFYRILHTFELHDGDAGSDLVWTEKSKLAIEEYIFARYYMYQNVYLHKTTRGFEKMLEAMWLRAKKLQTDGTDVKLVPVLRDFWAAGETATVQQYLRIEEFTVLQQIQEWTAHQDKALSDLAQRFLNRNRFVAIDPPQPDNDLAPSFERWERALHEVVQNAGYDPVESYCLKDQVNGKYNQPYFPEKESEEQSAHNAIRLRTGTGKTPVEISEVLRRLQPVTQRPADQVRYYVPRDLRDRAQKILETWKGQA
jgi:HD superfamily phosphohydrolase